MIGCAIVGGLLFLGAAKMIHRHRYGYACGGRWANHGCHGHARFGHGYGGPSGFGGYGGSEHTGDMNDQGPETWERGGPPRWILNRVLSRLQTSPSQSREVTAAFEEFTDEIKELRGEGKRTREDLSKALRNAVFDEVLLGELYARHDNVIEKGRKAFVGLLARVHGVLEEEQRERLADLLDKGPRFWRHRANW
ncbi:MAG: hypothetical protein SF187_09045 [Deltaproteobacteria bacterium]|nr:hypothetical protein [Deltaproteobacteria bacterium]